MDEQNYEELPNREWSKSAVHKLRLRDIEELFKWMPSIMQAASLTGEFRVRLALGLLNAEQNRSRRARIWDCLMICARFAPQSDFRDAAALAWQLIDSSTSDDATNPELCSVQDVLSDLRVFAEDVTTESLLEKMLSSTMSRYELFRALRAVCSYHDIGVTGKLAVKLTADADFVLRESGLNGISIIYSRADCDPDTLGALRLQFSQTLNYHRSDPHWYVRKANDNALFFQEQFDEEFVSEKGI